MRAVLSDTPLLTSHTALQFRNRRLRGRTDGLERLGGLGAHTGCLIGKSSCETGNRLSNLGLLVNSHLPKLPCGPLPDECAGVGPQQPRERFQNLRGTGGLIAKNVYEGVLKWSAHHSWRLGMIKIVLRRWQDGPGFGSRSPIDVC